MNKISLLLMVYAAIACISCGGGETEASGWKEYNLKGKVKSISIKAYNVEQANGQWVKTTLQSPFYTLLRFSTSGSQVGSDQYMDTTLVSRTEIKSTAEQTEHTTYNTLNTVESVVKMKHSSASNTTFEVYDASNNLQGSGTRIIEKGDSLQRIKETYTAKDGIVTENIFFIKRNSNGDTAEYENINNGRSSYGKYTYTKFDEQGNWTERLYYTMDEQNAPALI